MVNYGDMLESIGPECGACRDSGECSECLNRDLQRKHCRTCNGSGECCYCSRAIRDEATSAPHTVRYGNLRL